MLCFGFQGRLQLLGFLDHGHDLLIFAGSVGLFYADGNFAFFNNRSGIDRASLFLMYRNRFSGKGCLIDHCFSIRHRTVKRNHITHMNAYQILRLDRLRRYLDLLAVTDKPYLIDV